MCGRFVRTSATQAILQEFDAEADGLDIAPSYNIAPSQDVAVIIKDDRRRLVLCRWGFIPHWARDITSATKAINARAETVAVNRAFSAAFRTHRCLVAADGFYEWRRGSAGKVPVFIRQKSRNTPLGFAGLYSTRAAADGSVLRTCTIITTTANKLVRTIHDRMPVIIDKADYGLWLEHGTWDTGNKNALLALLMPYPDDKPLLEAIDVSTIVNSPRNNSPLNLTL
ncbi:SOS response-associated peptidase [Candidatus Magnetominusculus xianensis]|uniref:Abasic site processing protein n=1 Tax=Candidatus Magnetominusculus xianensis TaxID=1748249 RepID=A0ABR5SHY1_9BACT|nr:SOS response-associated peptidase [Candidatus Magnetominusculus xianensis]KWT84034.1 hypothetical protein ASN18_1961 [Candidatus Magnetominusculus xianensis]MBF0402327.1 SOS response-associated peptidase [Nitrospirota bacterium]